MQYLRVEDASQVGEARRRAVAVCNGHSFDEARLGRVALVVTELATNLVKHAHGGELIFHVLLGSASFRNGAFGPGFEILSLDKGPGIANLAESLRNGQSTAGSPGTGLGAIRRLSTVFDIYSAPGTGAALLSRIWKTPPESLPHDPFEVGVICLPVRGEEACGDAYAVAQSRDRGLVMAADGLGHGLYAAEAAAAAVSSFEKNTARSPAEILEMIHSALRSTRGAAVAVAEVMPGRRIVRYAGVGNISGRILSGETGRNMVSHNGTAGLEARKIQEFTYPWPENGLLIMHSDGLTTHWNLSDYPGLQARHPALIAGVLFRDHRRPRDDGVVVVVKAEGRLA